MVSKYGIHLPNGNLRDDSVFALGVSHYLMLHHQAHYAQRAREASPDGIIEIRFYLPNWSAADPRAWGEECAREYLQDRGGWSLDSLGCHVTLANEMNLASEGAGATYEWYQRINEWLVAAITRFYERTGCPINRMHFPAFAYGHSDDRDDYGFIGLEVCRQAVELCGALDIHPYWFMDGQQRSEWFGHRFVLAHELFPDKPIFCSESGNFDVTRESTPDEMIDWFESLYDFDYVLGGTPFIWEDPSGAHQQNDWSRNPRIAERVRQQAKRDVAGIISGINDGRNDNGGSMSLKDQFPNEFTAWEAAGGIENNFEAHLIGVGALPPTKERITFLAGELMAAANQVVQAVNALPNS